MKNVYLIFSILYFSLNANTQVTLETTTEAAGVVGGSEAEAEEYPWMCTITLDIDETGCGASLIRPYWVLTAGHCELSTFGISTEKVLINSLTADETAIESYSELINIKEFIVHEDYNEMSGIGPDIALIRLEEPSTITPIELAAIGDESFYEHGDAAQVLGWGLTGDGPDDDGSDVLLHANCRFFGSEECETLYDESAGESFYDLNAGGNICAGYFEGEAAAGGAAGDSGGPLFFEDGGVFKQVGVVSGGESSITTEGFPGVYTLVPAYLDWIENTIEEYEASVASIEKQEEENLEVVLLPGKQIQVNGLKSTDNYSFSVYNLNGQVLQQSNNESASGNSKLIGMEQVESGLYFVKVMNHTTAQITTKRFAVSQ